VSSEPGAAQSRDSRDQTTDVRALGGRNAWAWYIDLWLFNNSALSSVIDTEESPFLSGSNLLLSRRDPPFVGWVAIDEFEDLFSNLDQSRIAIIKSRRSLPSLLGKIRNRYFGPFVDLKDLGQRGELLLVVARAPSDLRMLQSVAQARTRFRNIAGYVIDSYFTEDFGKATKDYDHVFSTTEEGAEVVRTRFGVPSSVLRQGFDCLSWASIGDARSIDVVGFGRQPQSYHAEFQRAFHRQNSAIMYLHSPIGTIRGESVWTERPMMLKLLQCSKISLAFHLLVEPEGSRPRAASFVTNRWLESLSSGCVVLGKRPPGQMAAEMFCWPNALIDLPADPRKATEMIASLAKDNNFLRETRARNVIEMCQRHDWRYRIREIYQHFDLTLPPALCEELASLELLTKKLRSEATTL